MTSLPMEALLEVKPSDRRWLREKYDPWTWALQTARIRLPKGESLDGASHRYLIGVYRDRHPEIVVMKGAQMGFSTLAITRTFWMLTTFPCSAIYTFPTGGDVSEFTQARINPIVTNSEHLRARIVDVNSVHVKQFRVADNETLARLVRTRPAMRQEPPRSTAYFGGAASEKDAVAVDADLLVHDEVDLSNPQIIEQFAGRLDHSRFKWKFSLSTPRRPGSGVDLLWKSTDQRHWLITCPNCHAEFEMAFPGGPWGDQANIEPLTWAEYEKTGKARYRCHRCDRTLTADDRLNGRWEAFEPGFSKPHGYSVSQMVAPWIEPWQILDKYRKATWRSDFWNLTMGIPWQEETLGFTRESLIGDGSPGSNGVTDPDRPFMISRQSETDRYFMGVDPGGMFDYVIDRLIDGKAQTVSWGAVSSWGEVEAVYRRWRPEMCVVDGAYDPTKCEEFAAMFNRPGRQRVWLAFTGGNPKRPLEWDEKRGDVVYLRDALLSATADELLGGECLLPRFEETPMWERLIAHHVNSQKVPIWVKGLEAQRVLDRMEWHEVGPDHLFHAKMYARFARMAPRGIAPPVTGIVSFSRSGRRDTQIRRTQLPGPLR